MPLSRIPAELATTPVSFRNRIINGDMRIDQRNAGASVTANGFYTLDRWGAATSAASKYSVQRNAGAVTPPAGFSNYLGVTSLSAYSLVAGDYFTVYQTVEGLNVADLAWGTANAQTVTLSFWVRSSLTGTFGGSVSNGGYTRTYPFTYTVSAANTWEQKTVTIPGDTAGTWATDNTAGLIFKLSLGAGTTYSGSANAWSGSNLVQPTGSVSVVSTNGATFYITGVQLEAGTVATPFERRDYGRELMMCQRYYQTGGVNLFIYSATGNTKFINSWNLVEMRASPSLIVIARSDTIGSDWSGSATSQRAVWTTTAVGEQRQSIIYSLSAEL